MVVIAVAVQWLSRHGGGIDGERGRRGLGRLDVQRDCRIPVVPVMAVCMIDFPAVMAMLLPGGHTDRRGQCDGHRPHR